MKRIGFTLAEVLVTLTIIGIVASLTIPSLINNISDQQNKIAWKKAFADLSQVTQRVIFDNGGSLKGAYADANGMLTDYYKYLNYTKTCSSGTSNGNCWHNTNNMRALNGSITNYGDTNSFVLSNGNLVRFVFNSPNCTDISYNPGNPRCAHITIDVNGFSGPNTIGKDIFYAHITPNALIPCGSQGDKDSPEITCLEGSTAAANNGQGCSAKYLYQ